MSDNQDHKYTLYYFDAKGRAEPVRVLFAVAGVPFQDVRIDFKNWASFKKRTHQTLFLNPNSHHIRSFIRYTLGPSANWRSHYYSLCFVSCSHRNARSISETPMGQLPYLDVDDGKLQLCQSRAIMRYLAKTFGNG
jgi:glutathione S-transferase